MHFFKRSKQFAAAIVCLVIICLPLKSEAAVFSHTHSDACYTEESGTCSNHRLSSYSVYDTKHCHTCLVQTNHVITAWDDVCNNGLTASQFLCYTEQCTVCGTYRLANNPTLRPPHTYTIRTLSCAMPEGNLASVSMGKSTEEWTNGPVTLSVSVSNAASGFSLAAAPYDFGDGYTGSSSTSVSANGTYSASVKSSDGSIVNVSTVVSNIDTVSPSVSISKSTEAWTENGLKITVSAEDSESGLADAPYSFNGGAYTASSEYEVLSNGTVTVSVKDRVGNVSSGSITISNIGKDPAIIAREKAEKETREKEEREKAERERAEAEAKRKAEEEALKRKSEETGKTTVSISKDKDVVNNKENTDSKVSTGTETKKDPGTESEEKDQISSNIKNGNITGLAENQGDNTVNVGTGNRGILSGVLSVTDTTETGGNSQDNTGLKVDNESVTGTVVFPEELMVEGPEGEASSVSNKYLNRSSYGFLAIPIGISFVAAGLILILNFNYIYYDKNGKKKPVARVKVKKTDKRMIVYVSEKSIEKGNNYRIFFSPINRLSMKNKKVYVMIREKDTLINTDEGTGFAY